MASIFERRSSRNIIHILDNLSPPGPKTWIWPLSGGGGDCQICRLYFKETLSRYIEATLVIVHFQKDISRVYALLRLCKCCSCLQLLFFSGSFVHMVSSGRGHQIMGGDH